MSYPKKVQKVHNTSIPNHPPHHENPNVMSRQTQKFDNTSHSQPSSPSRNPRVKNSKSHIQTTPVIPNHPPHREIQKSKSPKSHIQTTPVVPNHPPHCENPNVLSIRNPNVY